MHDEKVIKKKIIGWLNKIQMVFRNNTNEKTNSDNLSVYLIYKRKHQQRKQQQQHGVRSFTLFYTIFVLLFCLLNESKVNKNIKYQSVSDRRKPNYIEEKS
jgi:hypothetical protein